MIDERLARGLTRRLLRDLAQPIDRLERDVDRLWGRPPTNATAQRRAVRRLGRRHAPVALGGRATRDGGRHLLVLPHWTLSDLATADEGYVEPVLATSTAALDVDRQQIEAQDLPGPVSLAHHAIRRMVERDQTLPAYSWRSWLEHLAPAVLVAGHLRNAADDADWLGRPVALPTAGGLFVCFMIGARSDAAHGACFEISAHSFYGPHELDPAHQALQAALLAARTPEALVAAHEAYGPGWRALWNGAAPKLLRAAGDAR